MNCPKCGSEFTAIGYEHTPDDWVCLHRQLATVTAERDAALKQLAAAILPNTRSSPLVEPENLVVKIYPATAEKGDTP